MDEKILLELNEAQWSIEALNGLARYIRMSGADESSLRYDHLMLVIEQSLDNIYLRLNRLTDYFDKKTLDEARKG